MEAGRDDYGLKKFGVELEKARLHIKKVLAAVLLAL